MSVSSRVAAKELRKAATFLGRLSRMTRYDKNRREGLALAASLLRDRASLLDAPDPRESKG